MFRARYLTQISSIVGIESVYLGRLYVFRRRVRLINDRAQIVGAPAPSLCFRNPPTRVDPTRSILTLMSA